MMDVLRIGSLFSGYGGLDLAVADVFDASVAWHVEYDQAPSKILAHHWPDVPNYGDVTTVDWTQVEPVDILTGGYPCQPFSAAGKRKGTDDERHLWPYVREAIRVLRPRLSILENVAGHRILGFDRVLGDLAEDGMHVRWTSVRASDVGAPHHRERIFILVTDPDGGKCDRNERAQGRQAFGREALARSGVGLLADDHGFGRRQGSGQSGPGEAEEPADLGVGPLPDAPDDGCERSGDARARRNGPEDCNRGIDWGAYGPAVRRWERLTRPAPAPTELNSNHRPRLNAAFAEWMMGLPDGHVTAVPGISRAHQLKAIGNGVCPQQASVAIRALVAMPLPK
jgi:DNA (cytosine-5)-methyltransferase 1